MQYRMLRAGAHLCRFETGGDNGVSLVLDCVQERTLSPAPSILAFTSELLAPNNPFRGLRLCIYVLCVEEAHRFPPMSYTVSLLRARRETVTGLGGSAFLQDSDRYSDRGSIGWQA